MLYNKVKKQENTLKKTGKLKQVQVLHDKTKQSNE